MTTVPHRLQPCPCTWSTSRSRTRAAGSRCSIARSRPSAPASIASPSPTTSSSARTLEEYGNPEIGGMRGSKQPTGPDGQWLEPMTVLSVIAGMTSRESGSAPASCRRRCAVRSCWPRPCATLDVLSGGRLDLGIGVGWQREEYEAAGLSFDGRGALLDDCLRRAAERLDASVPSSHALGQFLNFDRIYCVPQPLQPGGVPIWVSGTINQRILRRVTRFGSAWIPWGDDIRDPAPGLAKIAEVMAEARSQHGRLPDAGQSDGPRRRRRRQARPGKAPLEPVAGPGRSRDHRLRAHRPAARRTRTRPPRCSPGSSTRSTRPRRARPRSPAPANPGARAPGFAGAAAGGPAAR